MALLQWHNMPRCCLLFSLININGPMGSADLYTLIELTRQLKRPVRQGSHTEYPPLIEAFDTFHQSSSAGKVSCTSSICNLNLPEDFTRYITQTH